MRGALRLKAEMLRDVATPPPQRAAFRRFQAWTQPETSKRTERTERTDGMKEMMKEEKEKKEKTSKDSKVYQGDKEVEKAKAVLPLDLVQPDAKTLRNLQTLWRQRFEVISWYLNHDVFPKATPTQRHKFSACAQDESKTRS